MAERLTSFDFTKSSDLTKTHRATYPWDQWLDGYIWKLTAGDDFHAHPLMMERIIRTRATNRRAKIRLRHQPLDGTTPFGVIVLQRTDIPQPSVPTVAAASSASGLDGLGEASATTAVSERPGEAGTIIAAGAPRCPVCTSWDVARHVEGVRVWFTCRRCGAVFGQ